MKRLHGAHNKKVCDKLYLDENPKCNDWVVTTSFYSSIHYLDHALFPVKHGSQSLKNINEAYQVIGGGSKHQTRGILLKRYLAKHADDYEFLISQSQIARYTNYDVNDFIAQRSVNLLNGIIKSYDKTKKELNQELSGNNKK